MKTIKELADELGITKDKVKYQVGKLPGEYLVKKGNITYLKKSAETRLREVLVGNLPREKSGNFGEFSHLITHLEDENNFLRQQLQRTTEMLDQEQKLHAMSQQKVLMLETKKKGFFRKRKE